jgi:hypothetical protein
MSPQAEVDGRKDYLISALTLRILVSYWTEFDTVWQIANTICDRYDLGKPLSGAMIPSPLDSDDSRRV